MQSLNIIPVRCKKQIGTFNLSSVVLEELRMKRILLRSGDILVVSSKFAAMSEGRVVDLKKIAPTQKALNLGREYSIDPSLAQLILDESDRVIGGIRGFLLTIGNEMLAPNAGIDRSNVPQGHAILYPKNPERTAHKLRELLLLGVSRGPSPKNLGVILSDSRVTPTRLGTVGVALAVAGMRSTLDLRGNKDLFGNPLKVTLRAVADQLATAAELLMGEGTESIPVVIIRGLMSVFEPAKTKYEEKLTISPEKCLIIQGLKNGFINRKSRSSKYRH